MNVAFSIIPTVKPTFAGKAGSISIMTARQWYDYLYSIMDFLWLGAVKGERLYSIIGNGYIDIIDRDFSVANVTGGAAKFRLQPSAALIEDDAADLLWFDALGAQKDVTHAQLIAGDYRTLVCYESAAPYAIRMIGLLKKAVILNTTLINFASRDFWLWLFWSGFLNDFGYLKDNRLLP